MRFLKNLTNNNKYIFTVLFVILLLSAILRIWNLGSIPPSPNWDEVALGYNAYSILNTGRDEYGELLPIVLRSYDDYKPGLYTYLIIPLIPFFDLTAFTVRLPSAIFGIVGVLATFFLVRIAFQGYRYKNVLALLASFILAISPIALQVSRIAFETNVGMVLNLLAALFFLLGLKRGWPLLLSAAAAGLSIYTYQSEKVFTPLLMLALLIIYWKEFWKIPKKYIIAGVALGIIIVSPMALYLLNNQEALLRAQATSVLADKTTFLSGNVERLELDIERGDRIGQLLDNRRFEYMKAFISGYISHLDPNWIFVSGDLNRHHAPEMGLLYLWEMPFVLLGIYLLAFGGFKTKTKWLIFAWFLLAPVPAAFTTGVPHALRTLNFLPIFQILSALGIIAGAIWVSNVKYQVMKVKVRYFIFTFLVLSFMFNFIYFLNQYFSQQNYFYATEWQYGWKEAAAYVRENGDKYDKIVVSYKEPLDQAHMFFAFYMKFDPTEYQNTLGRTSGGFGVSRSFGKYEFRTIDWKKDSELSNTLFVGTPEEIPTSDGLLTTINAPDGSPVIKISETQ